MLVKLRSTYAGPQGVWPAGSVVDFSDREAYSLIEGMFAEQVDDEVEEARGIAGRVTASPAPQTATTRTPETASKRRRIARVPHA